MSITFDDIPTTVLPLLFKYLQDDVRNAYNLGATSRALRDAQSFSKRTLVCLACGRHVGSPSAVYPRTQNITCYMHDAFVVSDVNLSTVCVAEHATVNPAGVSLVSFGTGHQPLLVTHCNAHCTCGLFLGILVKHVDVQCRPSGWRPLHTCYEFLEHVMHRYVLLQCAVQLVDEKHNEDVATWNRVFCCSGAPNTLGWAQDVLRCTARGSQTHKPGSCNAVIAEKRQLINMVLQKIYVS